LVLTLTLVSTAGLPYNKGQRYAFEKHTMSPITTESDALKVAGGAAFVKYELPV